jgi:hypothetical protein
MLQLAPLFPDKSSSHLQSLDLCHFHCGRACCVSVVAIDTRRFGSRDGHSFLRPKHQKPNSRLRFIFSTIFSHGIRRSAWRSCKFPCCWSYTPLHFIDSPLDLLYGSGAQSILCTMASTPRLLNKTGAAMGPSGIPVPFEASHHGFSMAFV